MTTRFIKSKIDKYIQLYSQYAANEREIYRSILSAGSLYPHKLHIHLFLY